MKEYHGKSSIIFLFAVIVSWCVTACGVAGVKAPLSSQDACSMEYTIVVQKLREAGFSNISVGSEENSTENNNRIVKAIKIDGDYHFEEGALYDSEAPIEITYYTYVNTQELTEEKTLADEPALTQEMIDAATANLNPYRDEFNDTYTVYWSKSQTTTYNGQAAGKSPGQLIWPSLLVTNDGIVTMYVKVDYYQKDWIFFDHMIILCNGKKLEIDFDRNNKTEEVYASHARETVSWAPSEIWIEFFDYIIENGEAKVRLSGKDDHFDYSLSEGELNALSDILAAYHELYK